MSGAVHAPRHCMNSIFLSAKDPIVLIHLLAFAPLREQHSDLRQISIQSFSLSAFAPLREQHFDLRQFSIQSFSLGAFAPLRENQLFYAGVIQSLFMVTLLLCVNNTLISANFPFNPFH